MPQAHAIFGPLLRWGVYGARNLRWAQLKDHELDWCLALVGATQYRVDRFNEALSGIVDLRLTVPEFHGKCALDT
jgi:hypothetical protein